VHGNRKLFTRAHAKWNRLKDEALFSLPAELGKTAIISSSFTDEPLDAETGMTELEAFHSEAQELGKRTLAAGGRPIVAIDASRDDITDLIRDPEVATMYMIGNGSLSTLMLGEKDYYDWQHAADATAHLKLGSFIQRQCGGLSRLFNVPMGLFVVSDPRDVHATFNDAFYPLSLDDPVNKEIQPIFHSEVVDYDVIKALGSSIA
jgi:hypothetical protein